MGKASRTKRERKQSAQTLTQQVIGNAATGLNMDMQIVIGLTYAIEFDDLSQFQYWSHVLETTGGDVFHFEVKLIDEDGFGKDLSLLGYAILEGAADVTAWLLRNGMAVKQEEAMDEVQGLFSFVNEGGQPLATIARYEDLVLKIARPETIEEAQKNLATELSMAMLAKRTVQLWLQSAREFLATHGKIDTVTA